MSEPQATYCTRSRLSPQELDRCLATVSLVVFDVDGVLTDGRIGYVGAERVLFFHTHDGHGIRTLIETGAVMVAWCTMNRTMSIRDEARALKVTFLMQNCDGQDGRPTKKAAVEQTGIPWDKIVFMGDDLIDLPCMQLAAVAAAPANARPEILAASDWVSLKSGGQGAARDLTDLILHAKGYGGYMNPELGMVEWRLA